MKAARRCYKEEKMKPIQAYGRATVRLTDAAGRVEKEITAKNTLNADYAAEIKNLLFNPNYLITVYLSDYEHPAPANGLIFPMGRFLGYGRHGQGSSNSYQGAWSPNLIEANKQEKGLTSNTFVWDFTAGQAVGTLRSLFLYNDANAMRYPSLMPPQPPSWRGMPRWSVENKLLDVVAKTATQYCVGDYYTKEAVMHTKMGTLTLSGIARDVDSGHIFIFDAADRKLYEFESLDVDMTAENVLSQYACSKAYFGKGLIKGNNLFYLSGNANPNDPAAANPTGETLYLFRHAFKTNGVPEKIDTLSGPPANIPNFLSGDTCAFIDDYLVHHHSATNNTPSPVLRIVRDTAKAGFTGVYYDKNSPNYMLQRMSPNRQILLAGQHNGSVNRMPPMAISHLLLPEPIVKDDQRRLSISYTLSIQD
jgi:hypothetical protein